MFKVIKLSVPPELIDNEIQINRQLLALHSTLFVPRFDAIRVTLPQSQSFWFFMPLYVRRDLWSFIDERKGALPLPAIK